MLSRYLDCVVYDIEIANCIPDKKQPRVPEYAYCQGWEDYAGMGVGVLAAMDLRTGRTHIFCNDNLPAFGDLARGTTCVGFNNHGFDDRIVRALGISPLPQTFDILAALRVACGEPGQYTYGITRAGRTLDAVARANGTSGKQGMHGSLAPQMWQDRKVGSVIDYCLGDLHDTVNLVLRCPNLVDPVTGKTVLVGMPARALVVPSAQIDAERHAV